MYKYSCKVQIPQIWTELQYLGNCRSAAGDHKNLELDFESDVERNQSSASHHMRPFFGGPSGKPPRRDFWTSPGQMRWDEIKLTPPSKCVIMVVFFKVLPGMKISDWKDDRIWHHKDPQLCHSVPWQLVFSLPVSSLLLPHLILSVCVFWWAASTAP